MSDWERLPETLRDWHDRGVKHAQQLRPDERLWWHPLTNRFSLWPSNDQCSVHLVKTAGSADRFLQGLATPIGKVQRLLGGPNPVTAALVTSAIGAGGGYLAGAGLEQVIPEQVLDRGKLRRRLAVLGALPGLGLGAYWGLRLNPAHGQPALSNWPFDQELTKQAYDQAFEDEFGYNTQYTAGGTGLPDVPVDAFNTAVLRDPFTNPAIKGATVGLVAAAQQAQGGGDWVSPGDIARIAMGAGSGLLSGMIVGKVLGQLAGLSPTAQQQLQQGGMWAGILGKVIPMAFGR